MELEPTRRLLLAGDEESAATVDLLALLLGSPEAALGLIERFGSLGSLEEASPQELLASPAVGPRRAAVIRAALTLARRRCQEPPVRGRQIRSSRDVYTLLGPMLRHERQERMVAVPLDIRNRLIRSPVTVAVGSLTRAVVEPRELLRPLIVATAAAVVISHNHPSGCAEPSGDDITLSRKLAEATSLFGIRLLDHVIIADGSYVSLADRGLV